MNAWPSLWKSLAFVVGLMFFSVCAAAGQWWVLVSALVWAVGALGVYFAALAGTTLGTMVGEWLWGSGRG